MFLTCNLYVIDWYFMKKERKISHNNVYKVCKLMGANTAKFTFSICDHITGLFF